MKAQVSYSRKVCTPRQYENLSIGHQIEFEFKSTSEINEKFTACKNFVEDKIAQTLHEMEAQQ